MRLIDADKLKNEYKNTTYLVDHPNLMLMVNEWVDEAPTISLDEGVKIIWSAQIDDIMERIKNISTKISAETETDSGETSADRMRNMCIKILEEAKG